MSFDIIISQNTSENIRVTKDLTTVGTYTGTLKDNCSIIDPIFLVEADLADLKNANYCSVLTFGRSYFINDIISIRNGLVEIDCHVDVLSSFATEIKANKGIVFRQEESWNLYLNDGVLEVYQNPHVTTHEFPTGFSGQSYVLALAGRNGGGIIPLSGGYSENAKSLPGLLEYATAKIGCPYWFGTFGQIADANLYANRKSVYPDYYTAADFPSQYGQQVFDCVGLIKGYRWSASISSAPVYNAAQDTSVSGLFADCTGTMGYIGDTSWNSLYSATKGVCVFTQSLDHVGVYDGAGHVVEARGHAYGVVQTNLADRNFYYWGVPAWLANNTGIPVPTP